MHTIFRGFLIGWLLAVGFTSVHGTERSEGCTVVGVVTDHHGKPIVHAIISIFREGDEKEALVTASSDRSGKFSLSQLTPGVYRVLAAARGFQPLISEPTALQSGQTSQVRLTLRPAPDATAAGINPVKYQNRRNRGIFNVTAAPSGAPPDAPELAPALADVPAWHGTALVGSTGYATHLTAAITPTVDIGAWLQRDWEGQAVTLGGALRYLFKQHRGYLRWQTSQALASPVLIGPAHAPAATTTQPPPNAQPVRQQDIQVADAWQMTDSLQLLYGFDYLRVKDGAEQVWRPRLAAHWQPCSEVRFHTALTADGQPSPAWLSPEHSVPPDAFPPLPARWPQVDGRPVPARHLRVEAGAAWQPSTKTTVKVYAYQDWLDQHPLVLDGYTVSRLNGRTQGAAVLLTYRLRPRLAVTTAYAAGQAATLGAGAGQTVAAEPPAAVWQPSTWQVITIVAETVFPGSETRLQVGYRGAWGRPIHAIDPFTGRLPFTDAGLSFNLIQPLPGWVFLPGRWEAVVEARNLNEQRSEVTGLGALSGFPYRRTVRGGLRFRF